MSRQRDDTGIPDRIGLSRVEAARHIGISPPTLDRLVKNGTMPKPKRIFSRLVWDRREIDRAFAELGTCKDDEDEYAV